MGWPISAQRTTTFMLSMLAPARNSGLCLHNNLSSPHQRLLTEWFMLARGMATSMLSMLTPACHCGGQLLKDLYLPGQPLPMVWCMLAHQTAASTPLTPLLVSNSGQCRQET